MHATTHDTLFPPHFFFPARLPCPFLGGALPSFFSTSSRYKRSSFLACDPGARNGGSYAGAPWQLHPGREGRVSRKHQPPGDGCCSTEFLCVGSRRTNRYTGCRINKCGLG